MNRGQIIYFLLLVQFLSCQSPVKTYVVTSSFDIADSKENDVFIAEYIPEINEFNYGKEQLIIDKIWVENLWQYINYNRDIEKLDSERGYVKFENVDTDLFEIKFTIDGKENGISGNKLTFQRNKYPDSLTLNFMKKDKIVRKIKLNKTNRTE